MSIKYLSLIVLAVQNSALILVMRYSRTLSGPKYIPTTAVVLSEIIKCTVSFIIHLYIRWKSRTNNLDLPTTRNAVPSPTSSPQSFIASCFKDILQSGAILPVMIPAILYTIQNNLQYLAASGLDAATFQVLYQGKILTTALFAVIILRQKLTAWKWSAIFILTSGIVVISYPSSDLAVKITVRDEEKDNRTTGLIAVLAACVISGYTGVFLEYILKKAKNSQSSSGASQLWVRNVQLSTASVVVALIGAFAMNGRQIYENGFFYAYNPIVWAVIMLQAVGGLVVAVVITYADNILKGFATSLSLVFSSLISAHIGDAVLTQKFAVGTLLVLVATNMYGMSWGLKKTDELTPTSSLSLDQRVELHSFDVDSEKNGKELEESQSPARSMDEKHDGFSESTPILLEERKG